MWRGGFYTASKVLVLRRGGFRFINYMLITCCAMVKDPQDRPWHSLIGISFKVRCRWFTHLLKELWRSWDLKVHHQFTRPCSEFLVLHTSCAFLPWETDRLDCCERWFGSCLVEPARRDGRALHELPVPCRDSQMPQVPKGYLEIR